MRNECVGWVKKSLSEIERPLLVLQCRSYRAPPFYLVGAVKSDPFRNLSLGCEARVIGGRGLRILFAVAGSTTVVVLVVVVVGSAVFATVHL